MKSNSPAWHRAGRYSTSVFSLCLSLVAAFVLMSGAAAEAAKSIPTEVTMGKSVILTVPAGIERISVTDPGVADVVVITPTELQINGKAIGATSLIIWDKTKTKTFFDLMVVGDNTQLMERIGEAAPGDEVQAKILKDSVVLSGSVSSEERAKKIAAILAGYKMPVVNLVEVANVPQVLLQITVASVDRNATRELGINWSYAANSAIGVFSGVGGLTSGGAALSMLSNLVAAGSTTASSIGTGGPQFGVLDGRNNTAYFIKALSGKGLAKILAEPNLIVKSGESGEFVAGGEFPVPIVTTASGTGVAPVTVQYKEFGVKLFFKPVVKESGVIQLKLDPAEVSSLDFANAVILSGFRIPALKKDSVKTSVDLKDGESFVVAGLLRDDWSKNLDKIPLLGDIPILGAFFRDQRLQKTERELVFVVTPKLMKPMAPGQKAEIPGANEPTAKQEEDLRWIPMMPNYRSIDAEQLK
jgi:pilus assembly protein CpaC